MDYKKKEVKFVLDYTIEGDKDDDIFFFKPPLVYTKKNIDNELEEWLFSTDERKRIYAINHLKLIHLKTCFVNK